MKENWLDDIESRMSGYEVEEPARLWEHIAEQLPREEKRHPLVLPWWQRLVRHPYSYGVAAVALLTLVVSVSIPLFRSHEAATPAPSSASYSAAPSPSIAYSSVQSPLVQYSLVLSSSVPSYTSFTAPTSTEPTQTERIRTDSTQTEPIAQTVAAPIVENQDTAARPVIDCLVPKDAPLLADNAEPKKDRQRTFALSAYCSGGLNVSSTTAQAALTTAAVGSDGVTWEDAPILGIMLYNQGLPTHVRYKHYMPIRAGVHLAYRFHSRLAVETGVVYSCLLSDYEDGSDAHYIAGRQTLHYIGVPLNLTCRVYSWRRLDIYGSVGGMAELCVGGTQRTDYVLNSKTEQSTTERITEHPWQFSTTLSLGVQYNCLPWVGIYLEPGATYRFSDHSTLRSIYSQRPFNFSLNLGVRFSL